MGFFDRFRKRSEPTVDKKVNHPALYPLPHSSSVISVDLFSFPRNGVLPKYTYSDVPVKRYSSAFDHLMPYTILLPIYVDPDDIVIMVYFDVNNDDVKIGTLENPKMVKMVRDWSKRNWTCFGQVSPSGDEINLVFWDCE